MDANRKIAKSPEASDLGSILSLGLLADDVSAKPAPLLSRSNCLRRIASFSWWSPGQALDANPGIFLPRNRSMLPNKPGKLFLLMLDVGRLNCLSVSPCLIRALATPENYSLSLHGALPSWP